MTQKERIENATTKQAVVFLDLLLGYRQKPRKSNQ